MACTQAGDGVEAVFDDLEVWDAAPAADSLVALAAPAPIPTPEPTATAPVFDLAA